MSRRTEETERNPVQFMSIKRYNSQDKILISRIMLKRSKFSLPPSLKIGCYNSIISPIVLALHPTLKERGGGEVRIEPLNKTRGGGGGGKKHWPKEGGRGG
jgi:hypothetical protein